MSATADHVDVPASCHRHDAGTGAGSVLLDDGRLLAYDAEAFRAGGLRLLRPGQRVKVRLDGALDAPGTRVVAVTLSTFDL